MSAVARVPDQSNIRNRLLAQLPPADFARLASRLECVSLRRGTVIAEPGSAITHVLFLERGVGSVIAVSPNGAQVEAGLFGREGLAPNDAVVGSDRTPNRVVIQLPDEAWRIELPHFLAAAEASPPLRLRMMRWVQAFATQTAYTALSNAVHSIEERLARWILMCDDRLDGGDMALTHEFMAIMLAVRRPSVTTALHVLEGHGFIRTERGCVVVRNRRAMEAFAGDTYGKPEAEYTRLLGAWR